MKSGNELPLLQKVSRMFGRFTLPAGIVAWILLICGVIMLPMVFVLLSTFLHASQYSTAVTTRLQPPAQIIFSEGVLPGPPLHPATAKEHEERHRPDELPRSPSPPEVLPPVLDNPPETIHLFVDTSRHRLFVMRGTHVLRSAIVSTGKGTSLADPRDPDRVWVFQTPKGSFTIQNKLKDPVWIRPDWAFIEHGDPVPDEFEDRFMPGVLGRYALGFGNGYFIHGALYLNVLGQDVTHGCLQLHPEDLHYVFEKVPVGAPLFII